MKFSTISSLVLGMASYVAAIAVTAPAMNATVPASAGFTISWSSVNTDPSSVTIQLVNNAIYPPVQVTIASNIETSKGSYIVPAGVVTSAAGTGYQVNLISTSAQNTGILAQSNQFQIVAASASASSSVASSASSASSSMSSAASSSSAHASSVSSSASAAASSASARASSSGTAAASSAASSAASAVSSSAAVATHTGAAVANTQNFMGLVAGVAGVVAVLA